MWTTEGPDRQRAKDSTGDLIWKLPKIELSIAPASEETLGGSCAVDTVGAATPKLRSCAGDIIGPSPKSRTDLV